jgi:hypothetical protein
MPENNQGGNPETPAINNPSTSPKEINYPAGLGTNDDRKTSAEGWRNEYPEEAVGRDELKPEKDFQTHTDLPALASISPRQPEVQEVPIDTINPEFLQGRMDNLSRSNEVNPTSSQKIPAPTTSSEDNPTLDINSEQQTFVGQGEMHVEKDQPITNIENNPNVHFIEYQKIVDRKLSEIDKQIMQMEQDINTRIERMEQRVNNRLSNIERNFETMAKKLDRLPTNILKFNLNIRNELNAIKNEIKSLTSEEADSQQSSENTRNTVNPQVPGTPRSVEERRTRRIDPRARTDEESQQEGQTGEEEENNNRPGTDNTPASTTEPRPRTQNREEEATPNWQGEYQRILYELRDLELRMGSLTNVEMMKFHKLSARRIEIEQNNFTDREKQIDRRAKIREKRREDATKYVAFGAIAVGTISGGIGIPALIAASLGGNFLLKGYKGWKGVEKITEEIKNRTQALRHLDTSQMNDRQKRIIEKRLNKNERIAKLLGIVKAGLEGLSLNLFGKSKISQTEFTTNSSNTASSQQNLRTNTARVNNLS